MILVSSRKRDQAVGPRGPRPGGLPHRMYGDHTENVLYVGGAAWSAGANFLIPRPCPLGAKRAILVGMTRDWEGHLDRCTTAGLLDADSASRIRAWESTQSRSEEHTSELQSLRH